MRLKRRNTRNALISASTASAPVLRFWPRQLQIPLLPPMITALQRYEGRFHPGANPQGRVWRLRERKKGFLIRRYIMRILPVWGGSGGRRRSTPWCRTSCGSCPMKSSLTNSTGRISTSWWRRAIRSCCTPSTRLSENWIWRIRAGTLTWRKSTFFPITQQVFNDSCGNKICWRTSHHQVKLKVLFNPARYPFSYYKETAGPPGPSGCIQKYRLLIRTAYEFVKTDKRMGIISAGGGWADIVLDFCGIHRRSGGSRLPPDLVLCRYWLFGHNI